MNSNACRLRPALWASIAAALLLTGCVGTRIQRKIGPTLAVQPSTFVPAPATDLAPLDPEGARSRGPIGFRLPWLLRHPIVSSLR